MRTKKYMLNKHYAKLDKMGHHLSNDFLTHLKTYPDYDNIIAFTIIAFEYMMQIEDRFYCESNDDEDFIILDEMINIITSIKDLIFECEDIEMVIDED